MKSIGLFWMPLEQKDENTCPHKEECEIIKQDVAKKEDEFEIHVNFWNTEINDVVSHKRKHLYALDFGVVCPLNLKELVLLIPAKVEKDQFVDLVSRLASDRELMCTVFNENLTIASKPTKSYHLIKNEDESLLFLLYELSNENIVDINYSRDNGYTVIKIANNLETIPPKTAKNIYVRFRILLNDVHAFSIQRNVSNDWFQSAFSSSYMFDFRLNDVRELDKKVSEKLKHDHYEMAKLNKVHFFYMADADEVVENGSSMKLDSRLLETQRWHSYFGNNVQLNRENLAHHWKKCILKTVRKDDEGKQVDEYVRTPFDDFSLYFKVVYSHYKYRRVLIYSTIVFILGFLASSAVSFLQSLWNLTTDKYAWAFWLVILITVTLIFALCLKFRCRTN
ncbi:hypothetical protein [Segatella copri]|uniref:hypothetical protein n=1 Tax=Segatella copri TaxID=165179 RepID=UPI002230A7E9|nr:hypothetical protein [Segatella copri]MCW4084239.1 hypothetical protein [Segatella copri]